MSIERMNEQGLSSDCESARPDAFVVYKHEENSQDTVLCSHKSSEILLYPTSLPEGTGSHPEDVRALCKRWMAMLAQSSKEAEERGSALPHSFIIGLFVSGRRNYRVRGSRLYCQRGAGEQESAYFIFTLERIHRESMNLPKIFREARLSRREQDIVDQLLQDKCNKEIAEVLGLSQNTVKVYLRNVMRKLNVTSRTGIVSILLLARPVGKARKSRALLSASLSAKTKSAAV